MRRRSEKNTSNQEVIPPDTPHAPGVEGQDTCEKTPAEKKRDRTTGLRLFDVLLYPMFTNVVVFGISVGATYLTSRGNVTGGKIGKWFYNRGARVTKKLESAGMTPDQADMSKMVFFSFVDGSLIAPFVKLLEDRREKIAYALDKKMGTVPEDKSVYDAEPEQSWMSVIGGRLATCMIVVPTAVALDKGGLNKVLFKDPGLKMGKWIAGKPNLARHFHGLDIPELGKIGAFEAFYTSVCTGGLYFLSRCFASLAGRKHYQAHELNGDSHHAEPTGSALAAEDAEQGGSRAGWRKALAPPAGRFTDLAHGSEASAGMERA